MQISAVVLLTQLSADAPGRAAVDCPSACAPATHVGDVGGLPDARLRPGPVPTVAAIWGMERQVGDLCISLSCSFCDSAFQIHRSLKRETKIHLSWLGVPLQLPLLISLKPNCQKTVITTKHSQCVSATKFIAV